MHMDYGVQKLQIKLKKELAKDNVQQLFKVLIKTLWYQLEDLLYLLRNKNFSKKV